MISPDKKKYAVFTIDMERFSDTGCVKPQKQMINDELLDGLDEYLDLLDDYGIPSTIFALSSLALSSAKRLERHLKKGHEIALHGYEHTAPTEIDDMEFEEKLKAAKTVIENKFGIEVKGYRAPYFGINDKSFHTIRKLGFKYDSSLMNTMQHAHAYGMPDLTGFDMIKNNIFHNNGFYEFGMSCSQIFGSSVPISGGGYIRIGNWTFMKTMIQKYISKNDFYVFYLHPFEMSRHRIPKIKNLDLKDSLYLKLGFASFRRKIKKIIAMLKKSGFEFVTFSQLTDIFDEQEFKTNEQKA